MSQSAEIDRGPEFVCEGCGARVTDDGGDALDGWTRDADGEVSFCPSCSAGALGPPSPEVLDRLHAGARRQREFKDLLYAHREDALTCYDHPEHYCCVCGEHMAIGYREHLAAVLAKREADQVNPSTPTPEEGLS